MGISIREFARRDGCSDTFVRKAIKRGQLAPLADGSLDPKLVGSGWRQAHRRAAATAAAESEEAAPADLASIAERLVKVEGRAPYSLVEAERIKANYLALLRQLQYDRESGVVAAIEETVAAVAAEYSAVRNHLLGLPARLAPRVAMLRNAEAVRALLEREIALALEDLTLDRGPGVERATARE